MLFSSVSKWVLVLNYCKGNEFDLHTNTQLISIWMVVHQDSLRNWGMQQLGNGLLFSSKLHSKMITCIYTYSDILGVNPTARDPHNLILSFDCDLVWRRLCISLPSLTLVSRSISCSVHIVSAETALKKSSTRRSDIVSRTWRTDWRLEEG